MKSLKIIIVIILVLVFATAAFSQEAAAPAQDKSAAAPENNLLPIYKKGWQFFVAPYIWVPGGNINLARQGRFSGTTNLSVPT